MYNNQDALGFVETCGLAVAIAVADAMVKTANVTIEAAHMVDAGLVCVICSGDVASCKAAVDAGMATAVSMGTRAMCNVIARPAYAQGEMGILDPLAKINAQKAAKKATKQARLQQSAKTATQDMENNQKTVTNAPIPTESAALSAESALRPTESVVCVQPAQVADTEKAEKTEKSKKSNNKAKKK